MIIRRNLELSIAAVVFTALAALPMMAADYYWIGGDSAEWANGRMVPTGR